MAATKIETPLNPCVIKLLDHTLIYEIEFIKGLISRFGLEQRARIQVKVKTGTINFAVGNDAPATDPSASVLAWDAVTADGWIDLNIHNGQNNLFAQGAADNAEFYLAAKG